MTNSNQKNKRIIAKPEHRLQVNAIDQSTLLRLLLPMIRKQGTIYYKQALIKARRAQTGEEIVTVTDAGYETKNKALPGDYIITNATQAREQYIVPSSQFKAQYQKVRDLPDEYAEYQSTGKIKAIRVDQKVIQKLKSSGQFEIIARWGEKQQVYKGDYLVCPPEENEIYRIAYTEFWETYKEKIG